MALSDVFRQPQRDGIISGGNTPDGGQNTPRTVNNGNDGQGGDGGTEQPRNRILNIVKASEPNYMESSMPRVRDKDLVGDYDFMTRMAAMASRQGGVGNTNIEELYPSMRDQVAIGYYQGRRIGGAPIFGDAMPRMPFSYIAERKQAIYEKQYELMKRTLNPLDYKIPDVTPIYKRKYNDWFVGEMEKINAHAKSLGPNGWDLINSGNSSISDHYFRTLSNADALAGELNTIVSLAAEIKNDEKNFYIPDRTIKEMRDVLGGMIDIENGKMTNVDIGKSINNLETYMSLHNMMKDDWRNIRTNIDTRIVELKNSGLNDTKIFQTIKEEYLSEDASKRIAEAYQLDKPWIISGDPNNPEGKPFTIDEVAEYVGAFFNKQVTKQLSGYADPASRSMNVNVTQTKDKSSVPAFILNTLQNAKRGGSSKTVKYGNNKVTVGKGGATFVIDGNPIFVPGYDSKGIMEGILMAGANDSKNWGSGSDFSVIDALEGAFESAPLKNSVTGNFNMSSKVKDVKFSPGGSVSYIENGKSVSKSIVKPEELDELRKKLGATDLVDLSNQMLEGKDRDDPSTFQFVANTLTDLMGKTYLPGNIEVNKVESGTLKNDGKSVLWGLINWGRSKGSGVKMDMSINGVSHKGVIVPSSLLDESNFDVKDVEGTNVVFKAGDFAVISGGHFVESDGNTYEIVDRNNDKMTGIKIPRDIVHNIFYSMYDDVSQSIKSGDKLPSQSPMSSRYESPGVSGDKSTFVTGVTTETYNQFYDKVKKVLPAFEQSESNALYKDKFFQPILNAYEEKLGKRFQEFSEEEFKGVIDAYKIVIAPLMEGDDSE